MIAISLLYPGPPGATSSIATHRVRSSTWRVGFRAWGTSANSPERSEEASGRSLESPSSKGEGIQ